jgi:hypothetical protein
MRPLLTLLLLLRFPCALALSCRYKFLSLVRGNAELAETFSEAQLKEGMDMLDRILSTRVKLLGESHIATGEVKYTVGLLLLFLGKRSQAFEYVRAAQAIYTEKLGEKHPSTADVTDVAESIQREMDGPEDAFGGGGGEASGGGLGGDVAIGIHSGGVDQMEGFETLINQFPEDMPRATTQSPIPMPPSRQKSAGVDDSMRMTPSGSQGRVGA